jgi:hypothetical protein
MHTESVIDVFVPAKTHIAKAQFSTGARHCPTNRGLICRSYASDACRIIINYIHIPAEFRDEWSNDLLRCMSIKVALRDISLDRRIGSLSGHSGHGRISCWLNPVIRDPNRTERRNS